MFALKTSYFSVFLKAIEPEPGDRNHWSRDRVRRSNEAGGRTKPEPEIIGPETASGGRTKPEPKIIGPETASGGQKKLEAKDRGRRPKKAGG